MSNCNICGASETRTVYDGPIRGGGVTSEFVNGYKVVECTSCKAHHLSPFPAGLKEFYESDEYRKHFDYTTEEADLARKFDYEQNDRVQKVGVENLRNKVVGDFGCGIGLFLDVIKGVTKRTIAVEPMETFGPRLRAKGHEYFQYATQLMPESLDVALSFDTLEHIDQPVKFLTAVQKCLKPGGTFYLSLPNRNDVLMHAHKEVYQRFFYCTAHVFYYDSVTLVKVAEKAGFRVVEKSGLHKYDFHNVAGWLQTGKPAGRKETPYVDKAFEAIWKSELIRMDLGSHLFLKLTKV